MADEPEARDSDKAGQEPAARADQQSQPRSGTGPPAKPPRPAMSSSTPAPVQVPITPAGPVKAARSLWLMSFVAGLTAIVFAFLARSTQFERLRRTVTELGPDQEAQTLDAVAAAVFWGSLGALVLVIVLEALLLRAMMRRHGRVRWALLVMLFVHAAAAVVAEAFIAAPGGDGIAVRLLLAAQLLLAGAALVISALPGSGVWFRAEHQTRGRGAG